VSGLTEADVYDVVRGLLEFPYPTICRHLVAGNLLDLLEQRGHAVDDDLVRAVVRADDARALALLPPAQGAPDPG
jgi:hypothetical protein